GTVCVVGKMRDLILQLSKSSIYSTKPFGPRNAVTLQRLLALLSKFNIAFYMTDAWQVYRMLLDSASHVVSKKYTQRIERHNLNLRTHLKRLTRRTICFSKSEEMHDKVIGWYLTINHYH
ncbi:IS1 family transposase, partial [Klebsiella variicola]|uniref:IS1 family transposase n=1 Tax=Klebsiella variicola TaxID=244366 RepID=UPI003905B0A4